MSQGEFFLLFGVCGSLSVGALIIGIISYLRTRSFLDRAIETRGVVVEKVYKGESDEGGGSMFSPKIRFTDRMGQQVDFIENWSTNRPDFIAGQEVVVLYDPAKPHKARRGGKKWKLWFVTWLVGGLGLFFTLFMIFMLVLFLFVLDIPVPNK